MSDRIYVSGIHLDIDEECGLEQQGPDWVPAVVRGFDRAGHQLAVVHAGARLTPKRSEYRAPRWSGDSAVMQYVFDGFTDQGHATEWTMTATNDADEFATPELWEPPPRGWRASRMAVNADGWLYVASAPITLPYLTLSVTYQGDWIEETSEPFVDFFRVYRPEGDRVAFPQLHGARIYAVLLDDDGAIYVGGDEYFDRHVGYPDEGGYHLRKYSADGATLLWSVRATWLSHGFSEPRPREKVQKMRFGPDGLLYVMGEIEPRPLWDTVPVFWACYDPDDGSEVWKRHGIWKATAPDYNLRDAPRDFLVAPDGTFYTGGFYGWNSNDPGAFASYVQIRDPATGAVLVQSEAGATDQPTVSGIALWDGVLYVALRVTTLQDVDVIRMDPETLETLSEEDWDTKLGGIASASQFFYDDPCLIGAGFEVDATGRFYFGTTESSGTGISGYSAREADGSNPWAALPPIVEGMSETGCDYGLRLSYTPRHAVIVVPDVLRALPLGFPLAPITTVGDTYTRPSGLALPVPPALPWMRREYVGALLLPDVYRLDLDGIALPVSSLSITRAAGQDSVTAVVPSVDGALLAVLLAHATGTLRVWRGVRITGGYEQMELLVSGDLSGVRTDRGSARSSATLSMATAPFGRRALTRVLRGVSYRALSGGKRRVRCAVDTWLSPGDTAVIGPGESMLVGQVSCSVTPEAASMEAAEA